MDQNSWKSQPDQPSKHLNENVDSLAPLPAISGSAKFTPKQDEIRIMNVLNGEIERRWSLNESGDVPISLGINSNDRLSTSQDSSDSSYQQGQSSNSINRTWTDGSRRHSADTLASSNTLIIYPILNSGAASNSSSGSAANLRRKIINSKPKPIAYHRVKDMFEEENHPERGEMIGERVVTSMIKHEKLLEHSSSTSVTGDHSVSTAAGSIDKSELFQTQDDNFMDTGITRNNTSYGSLYAETQKIGSSSQSNLPKMKRKYSIDSSPDSNSRYSPYSVPAKKPYIRPGTPSPASSSSNSPWISHMTPEKLRKLRPSLSEPSKHEPSDAKSSISNSSTMQSLVLKRDSTRFSTLSPDTEQDDEMMTPIDLNESSNSRGFAYDWRQTDDDEETWEHDD